MTNTFAKTITKNTTNQTLYGAGLGFRRELLFQLQQADLSLIDFFEVSAENWITETGVMGGRFDAMLRPFTERYAFACHGLSLSIGSTATLNVDLVKNIGKFLDTHNILLFTEHLSWCSDKNGHLYDLFPIPCTEEAVFWVAKRIRQIQDILGRQIGLENASYYYQPSISTMSDSEFITAVIQEADCLLHLDVNNVFVNSHNFGFDVEQYLQDLPLEKTCYIHVAGHYVDDDLIIDTHGASVIDGVWQLLDRAYMLIFERTGKQANDIPTCLERDFNFPPLADLLNEVAIIKQKQAIRQNQGFKTIKR